MQKISVLLLLLLFIAVPVSAAYTNTFDSSISVVVNQSLVQDPTRGESTPWILWIISGIIGLLFSTFALTRSKTQKMDYEVNIIMSIIAWPFFGYFAWGGMTSVDYIVGISAASLESSGGMATITQHILYSPWVLGWIGVMGSIAAVFITTLLVSQYNLFKDNEAEEATKRAQSQSEERRG